jgi:RES domain-containing protein
MLAYRLVQAGPYANNAFSGEGARRYGGRWNPKGVPAVYCSEHLSLAVLEFRVNQACFDPNRGYVFLKAEFEDEMREALEELPVGWRKRFNDDGSPTVAQELGGKWSREQRSAILSVPSSVIEVERNFIFNPLHPDFLRIRISSPKPLELDERLWG